MVRATPLVDRGPGFWEGVSETSIMLAQGSLFAKRRATAKSLSVTTNTNNWRDATHTSWKLRQRAAALLRERQTPVRCSRDAYPKSHGE